jgi:hypothetical protein
MVITGHAPGDAVRIWDGVQRGSLDESDWIGPLASPSNGMRMKIRVPSALRRCHRMGGFRSDDRRRPVDPVLCDPV